MVDACNRETSFANMANCAELGPHGWGHNGIGSVMGDVYTSPGDPVFWLHHAFIDRNFRIWQNADRSRVSNIDGTDIGGNRLTLDTTVNVYDMRPTVRIRDLLDTTSNMLCYKYNY
jgi:tyrosinase